MKSGIDISRWQKGFNLQNAINEGFNIVILKAGGADAGRYKDGSFDTFYAQAKSLNMPIGSYYFGQAFSVADAQAEANHFISLLQGKDIKNVYYDVEAKMLNQGYTHLTEIILAFVNTMTSAGYNCGVYTSESHFNNKFNDSVINCPHWVARYSKTAPKLKSGKTVDIWQYGGSVNYIRSAKIAGTTVDQDYFYTEFTNEPIIGINEIYKKSVSQLAEEVLKGVYGNGEDRKLNLGARYKEVQAEVDRLLKERQKEQSTKAKTIDQLAIEVLAGVYGNGITRRLKLGSLYAQVQKRVDELVAERKTKDKTYVVVKGDTLTKIAKKFNTTVDRLVKANNIKNKNIINIGQELIIR